MLCLTLIMDIGMIKIMKNIYNHSISIVEKYISSILSKINNNVTNITSDIELYIWNIKFLLKINLINIIDKSTRKIVNICIIKYILLVGKIFIFSFSKIKTKEWI